MRTSRRRMGGAELKSCLKAIGWSANELARRSGYTPSGVKMWAGNRATVPQYIANKLREIKAVVEANPLPPKPKQYAKRKSLEKVEPRVIENNWFPIFDGDDPQAQFINAYGINDDDAMTKVRHWMGGLNLFSVRLEGVRKVPMQALVDVGAEIPAAARGFTAVYVADIIEE